MAVYDQGADQVINGINNSGMPEDFKGSLTGILDDLKDADGNIQVDNYNPDSPPAPGTDYLIITGGPSDPLEVSLTSVGNVPIIDASNSNVGIRLDLTGESAADGHLPDMRVILSSHDDVVLGGKANLIADLGAGDDTVTTGLGNDKVYMGTGNDSVFVTAGGNDFIDGGAGDDSLIFTGHETDWAQQAQPDGTVTWTNTSTGQTVTTKSIEHISFDLDHQNQADDFQDPDLDPDDL